MLNTAESVALSGWPVIYSGNDSNKLPGRTDQWWREEKPKAEWPLYEHFPVFLAFIWKHLGLPKPTPVQYDIAQFLQYGPRRCTIEAFRGVGKSWIAATFVLWLLLRDKELKIMVVSASKERADNFTTFCLQLLRDVPLLQHLMPEPGQRESKVSFDVAGCKPDQAPSVRSIGVGGQMTGGRADIIIPDDVEVPNNSETVVQRAKLAERIKEFDAILKPKGHIKFLGTPQDYESIYVTMEERGYGVVVWPALVPTGLQRKGYGSRLAPMIDQMGKEGAPTDPRRFDEADLMERMASYGRSGFALQFMLDTSLSDAEKYPLKLSDLIVDTVDPKAPPERVMYASGPKQALTDLPLVGFSGDRYHQPLDYLRHPDGHVQRTQYTGRLLTIDPSGRGKDETSWNVTLAVNAQIHLPLVRASRDGYTEKVLTQIAADAKQWEVNTILIEANFGDGMFAALLQPYLKAAGHRCEIVEERSSGQKERRIIDTLEPVMNQHRLIIDPSVIRWDFESVSGLPPEEAQQYRLFWQMTHLSKERGCLKHDDRLDGLAIAVKHWVDQMNLVAEDRAAKNRAKALDEELRKFMKTAGRNVPARDMWNHRSARRT